MMTFFVRWKCVRNEEMELFLGSRCRTGDAGSTGMWPFSTSQLEFEFEFEGLVSNEIRIAVPVSI